MRQHDKGLELWRVLGATKRHARLGKVVNQSKKLTEH